MTTPRHTPKRALLQCQWQIPESSPAYPIIELGSDDYVAVNRHDILTESSEDELRPEWLGKREAFPHKHIIGAEIVTYSGYVACHVMWPFDPSSSRANVLIGIWEDQEDFRVAQVDPTRLLVARALVDYISPTAQRSEFVDLLADQAEKPRSDTFM